LFCKKLNKIILAIFYANLFKLKYKHLLRKVNVSEKPIRLYASIPNWWSPSIHYTLVIAIFSRLGLDWGQFGLLKNYLAARLSDGNIAAEGVRTRHKSDMKCDKQNDELTPAGCARKTSSGAFLSLCVSLAACIGTSPYYIRSLQWRVFGSRLLAAKTHTSSVREIKLPSALIYIIRPLS
jgi:hypothetical protein